jgi:hypothetical protein
MKKYALDQWRAYLLAQASEYRVDTEEKRPAITISRETGCRAAPMMELLERGMKP